MMSSSVAQAPLLCRLLPLQRMAAWLSRTSDASRRMIRYAASGPCRDQNPRSPASPKVSGDEPMANGNVRIGQAMALSASAWISCSEIRASPYIVSAGAAG